MSNLEKLQAAFNRAFENCPTIDENTDKLNFEPWDSLGHLVLILEIEKAFDIKLKPEQIENLKSVKEILNLL